MENNLPKAGGPIHNGHVSLGHLKKLKKGKYKTATMSIMAVVVVAVISFVGLSIYKSSTAANIEADKYQAVFLTNGQVYFGKLKTFNSDYMKLVDIFYLQTKSTDASGNPQKTADQSTPNVELIKLGSEIHGPDDEMVISKQQILFFENLKKDSQVAKTITEFKNKK